MLEKKKFQTMSCASAACDRACISAPEWSNHIAVGRISRPIRFP